jgi:hypothetical protein
MLPFTNVVSGIRIVINEDCDQPFADIRIGRMKRTIYFLIVSKFEVYEFNILQKALRPYQ